MLIELWDWFLALPAGVLLLIGVHVLMHEVPMVIAGVLFFVFGCKSLSFKQVREVVMFLRKKGL